MQTCPNCSFANRPGVVFCENCGTTLIGAASSVATRALTPEQLEASALESLPPTITELDTPEQPTPAVSVGDRISLEVGEARPVDVVVKETLVLGRRDTSTGTIPDVDLTPYAGYRMGVSRRHSEIRFNSKELFLELWDLGSSNGTFLNGDRLISHKGYKLKDGDQIRFGQLSATIRFKRKSD